jgi:hypothetical protein
LGVVAAAEDSLNELAGAVASVTAHHATGNFPHQYSALALAGLSAGPGSDLQQQLFSLLSSITKIGTAPVPAMVPRSTAEKSIRVKADLIKAAGLTAAALVTGAVGMQQPDPSESGGGGGGSSGGSGSTPGPAVVMSLLPGVLIIGRCCICWARQLNPAVSAQAEQLQRQYERWILPLIALDAVQQWLQASGTQEQLVAAGYAPPALLQQVEAATRAISDVGPDTTGALAAVQQMQAAGSALCSFAVPCMCNNPSCAHLSGLTDVGLVSGRSCVCGGCHVARYCGRTCQRAVWKQHKPVCAALVAAAAATATPAAVQITVP